MIEISRKADCSGCHACQNACPSKCITMKEDEQGFLYPDINTDKCVNCGICERVCHMKQTNNTRIPAKAYAGWNKDLRERMNSSSGGMFVAIAKQVIAEGGTVYGAAFDKEYNVNHVRVDTLDGLEALQTSKYVQSLIGNCYAEAKDDLDNGKRVLFTGTPCQIAGFKAFLRKDYDNLICQDIMCHGVPSPKFWRKYLKELKPGKITDIQFRDKSKGWHGYRVRIDGENCHVFDEFNKNTYMRAFIADASLRPSCYECHYKHLQFAGDYVLADFWGVSEVFPELDDDKGTSLILINSEKGEKIISSLKEFADIKEVDIDKAVKKNGPAINGAAMNEKNVALFNNIDNMTVHRIVEKYIRGSFWNRVRNKLKK